MNMTLIMMGGMLCSVLGCKRHLAFGSPDTPVCLQAVVYSYYSSWQRNEYLYSPNKAVNDEPVYRVFFPMQYSLCTYMIRPYGASKSIRPLPRHLQRAHAIDFKRPSAELWSGCFCPAVLGVKNLYTEECVLLQETIQQLQEQLASIGQLETRQRARADQAETLQAALQAEV